MHVKETLRTWNRQSKTWKERAFKEKDTLKKMLELWGTKIERELASLDWVVTPSGGKYHVHDCNHAKGNGRKYLPCKHCVHGAIRGVIELSRRTIQWCHMSPWSSVHEKISMTFARMTWHKTWKDLNDIYRPKWELQNVSAAIFNMSCYVF